MFQAAMRTSPRGAAPTPPGLSQKASVEIPSVFACHNQLDPHRAVTSPSRDWGQLPTKNLSFVIALSTCQRVPMLRQRQEGLQARGDRPAASNPICRHTRTALLRGVHGYDRCRARRAATVRTVGKNRNDIPPPSLATARRRLVRDSARPRSRGPRVDESQV